MRLWLQGDNTPKELRNSICGKWACMMCQARYFKSVSHHHMVVGHTHEDIGLGFATWLNSINQFLPSNWGSLSFLSLINLPCCADGIFSLVTAAIRAERELLTPQDVMRFLGIGKQVPNHIHVEYSVWSWIVLKFFPIDIYTTYQKYTSMLLYIIYSKKNQYKIIQYSLHRFFGLIQIRYHLYVKKTIQ